MSTMTDQQDKAIKDVRKILKANFDSFLLTYRITNENLGSKINHEWHGHVSDVVGLASIAQNRMLQYSGLNGGSDV